MNDKWFDKHFPNSRARGEADRAIDKLSVNEPMHVYIDTWIAAYKAAGGKVKGLS